MSQSSRFRPKLALAALLPVLLSALSCGGDDLPSTSEAEAGPTGRGSQSPPGDAGSSAATGRFEVRGDGTVLDPLHELIWTQHAPEQMSWHTARQYCTEFEAARGADRGFPDPIPSDHKPPPGTYHLPTLAELKTIQEMQVGWASAVNPNVFPNTAGDWFWTSTIAEQKRFGEEPSPGRLSFAEARGITEYGSPDPTAAWVRCVKSTKPEPSRFEAQVDGFMKDNETSLFWQPMRTDLGWVSSCTANQCTQPQAAETCSRIPSGGGGWRLPTARQVTTLFDARFYPAIRPEFFVGAETEYYNSWPYYSFWTSDVKVITPGDYLGAYQVGLEGMSVGFDDANGFAKVLCVR